MRRTSTRVAEANGVVSNLKRENLKLYNELKEANVQMQLKRSNI